MKILKSWMNTSKRESGLNVNERPFFALSWLNRAKSAWNILMIFTKYLQYKVRGNLLFQAGNTILWFRGKLGKLSNFNTSNKASVYG